MTVDDAVDGNVIIVTGASKGVGRGIALHLARSGATLVITARRSEALEETAAELDEIGAPHLSTTLDVADREGAFALVERTVAEFGRVDGLVANAQTFRSVTPFADITEHDMDVLLDTGPKGTLWGMQAVFPHMREQGRGRIVTMGSNAALLGAVGYAPYASSKEAIRALTRSAAARANHHAAVRLRSHPPAHASSSRSMNRCRATAPGASQVCTIWSMPRRRRCAVASASTTSASDPKSQSSGSAATPSSSRPSSSPSASEPVPVTTALRPVIGDTVRRRRASPASPAGAGDRMRTTVTCQMSMMAPPSAIRVWPVM